MKWAGLVARKGDLKSAYSILVEKHGWKSLTARPRRRWEDNIKRILKK
jgi:hypothetical protein